jgi:folate-dependent phosphoribosylglycinamide formyltransferase PurN
MRIALCSAYPLADRHYHRKLLLHELCKFREEGIVTELHLLYGGIMPAAYLDQFKRMGGLSRGLNGFRQVSHRSSHTPDAAPDPVSPDPASGAGCEQALKGFTWKFAKDRGIKIALFRKYGEPASLEYFDEHKIDLAINLSGLYLPKKILERPRLAFQGGHYGVLPDLRGGDTVRWTIWKNKPLVLSHMTLAPKMDMGDILRLKELPVYRTDSMDDLRKRCQLAAVEGHIECVRQWADGTIERQPQQEADGQVYYLMGERLIAKTDKLLKEGRYDHFAS